MAGQRGPVLITGATGRIGGELARLLAAGGFPLRVLARNPERARASLAAGVEVVRGEFGDPGSVAPALAGCERLFLLSPDHPRQAERECAIIDLAAAAGVRHIVKVSAYAAGLDPPVAYGVLHRQVERHLEHSGLAWTVLRPYVFMQNFLEFAGSIASKREFMAPFGKARIAFIDARDVARVAAAVLSNGGHESRCYELTGPAALSAAEAAEQLSAALGRSVRYRSVPGWLASIGMRLEGVSAWDVRMRGALFKMVRAGGESRVSTAVEQLSGSAPRSFREFVAEHARAFAAP